MLLCKVIVGDDPRLDVNQIGYYIRSDYAIPCFKIWFCERKPTVKSSDLHTGESILLKSMRKPNTNTNTSTNANTKTKKQTKKLK